MDRSSRRPAGRGSESGERQIQVSVANTSVAARPVPPDEPCQTLPAGARGTALAPSPAAAGSIRPTAQALVPIDLDGGGVDLDPQSTTYTVTFRLHRLERARAYGRAVRYPVDIPDMVLTIRNRDSPEYVGGIATEVRVSSAWVPSGILDDHPRVDIFYSRHGRSIRIIIMISCYTIPDRCDTRRAVGVQSNSDADALAPVRYRLALVPGNGGGVDILKEVLGLRLGGVRPQCEGRDQAGGGKTSKGGAASNGTWCLSFRGWVHRVVQGSTQRIDQWGQDSSGICIVQYHSSGVNWFPRSTVRCNTRCG